MKIRHAVLFVFAAAVHLVAEARVILISDIDDTIRVSHVRDKFKVLIRGIGRNEAFTGMAPLYHLVKSMPEGAQVAYVSNKPLQLELAQRKFNVVSHQKFLAIFPDPESLYLRTEGGALDNNREDKRAHKRSTIQHLLREAFANLPPGERLAVAMVGDNGEDDPLVYEEAVRLARPQLTPDLGDRVRFYQYIRNVYGQAGTPLAPGQRPFTSAAELGLLLAGDGFFDPGQKSQVRAFTRSLPPVFSNHARKTPAWIDCRNHPLDTLKPLTKDPVLADAAVAVQAQINQLCSLPGEAR